MISKIFKAIGIYLLIMFTIIIIAFISIFYVHRHKSSASYVSAITLQAINTNNPSLCSKIHIKLMSYDGPKRLCYEKVAIQNKNLSACINIGWPCYASYFTATKDTNVDACNVFKDTVEKNICQSEQNRLLSE